MIQTASAHTLPIGCFLRITNRKALRTPHKTCLTLRPWRVSEDPRLVFRIIIRPFESALLPVLSVPQWTGCVDVPVLGSAVAGAKKIGGVKARTPDFKCWWFGIYQLPIWLVGSRTSKLLGQKERAKGKGDGN